MSGLYDSARQKFLEGGLAWLTDTVKAILIDTTAYTVDLAAHDFLNDVPSGARIAVSDSLDTKSSTAGVADAGNVTFTNVSGPQCDAMILYKHTGVESSSALIAYMDAGVGLPVLPTGGDIVMIFSDDVDKIFKL